MKLVISNFQDIAHLELRAEKNSVLHISGKSGCGKSAIFEAIYWCLYGSVGDVEKRGLPGKKLYVAYEPDEETKIYRQRNPKAFTVTHKGNSFEGVLATEKLLELFGADKEGWLATSYIHQAAKPHFILTLPPKERYHVLLRMSMRGEDAEPYVKKIEEKIKSLSEQLDVEKKEYNQALVEYEKLCKRYNVTFDSVLSVEKQEEHEQKVITCTQQLAELNKELNLAQQCESKMSMVANSLLRFEKQRTALLQYSEERLQQLREQGQLWQKHKVLQEEKELCEKQLSLLKSKQEVLPDLNVQATPELIARVSLEEETYNQQCARAQKLNVVYATATIEQEIQTCRVMLASQEKASLYALTRNKLQERNSLLAGLSTEPILDLVSAESKIKQCQEQLSILKENYAQKKKEVEQKSSLALENELTTLRTSTEAEKAALHAAHAKEEQELRATYTRKYEELLRSEKEAEQTLASLDRARAVHQCPYCEGSLRYVKDKLEKCAEEPFQINKYVAAKQQLSRTKDLLLKLNESNEERKKELVKSLDKSLTQRTAGFAQKETQAREQTRVSLKNDLLQLEKDYADLCKQCEVQLEQYKSIKQVWTERERVNAALNKCNAEIASLPELDESNAAVALRVLSPTEIAQTQKRLTELCQLQVVSPPSVSSEHLRKVLRGQELGREIELYSTRLHDAQKELDEMPNAADLAPVKESELKTYTKKLEEKVSVESQIRAYEADLASIEKTRSSLLIEKEITNSRLEKERAEKALLASKRATILVAAYEKLNQRSQVCEDLHQKQVNVQQLLMVVQEAVVESLASIINATNNYLSLVVKKLFDDPMEIRLSTEKELKSGNKKKQITLSINYKGGLVHNFDRGLSAGEKVRINTILSLAFAQHCNSPILILDEAVSLLDDLTAQELMELIRDEKYGVPGRLVLLASQNCSSGLVDKVVPYESLL